ncbi:MAG: hypothetical protein AB8A40_08840 [Prochlorococcus sp.]
MASIKNKFHELSKQVHIWSQKQKFNIHKKQSTTHILREQKPFLNAELSESALLPNAANLAMHQRRAILKYQNKNTLGLQKYVYREAFLLPNARLLHRQQFARQQ